MGVLVINGPCRLSGHVRVAGAKNAALPILAASLLCDRPFVLTNVPWVGDVATMLQLLRGCGVGSSWRGSHELELQPNVCVEAADQMRAVVAGRIRASFCLLGPLLARFGRATLPLPGGCRIGPRPVDLHLEAMRRLGAEVRVEQGLVHAESRQLRGAIIHLASRRGPTVTGTCNAMMAAVGAAGETVLFGAAREPEVVALGRFLQACGVRIEGLGTSTLRIEGARLPLAPPLRYRLIADRIEAATWLCAAVATGGSITISGTQPAHLEAVLGLLSRIGARIEVNAHQIRVIAPRRPRAFLAVAQPYPGIPTDVQAQLAAVAAVAEGESEIRDTVFPTRWQHVVQLRRLGALARVAGDRCVIRGGQRLRGTDVEAVDLRASAALVIAGLCAEGEVRVHGIEQLERGYEDLPHKLRMLGAQLKLRREPFPDAAVRAA